eukprot:TRINITY_DN7936_c0_g2_i1.p2 TRINITY_DN7936_c0_g2~~TRINITY_DN7936_c0_g2_i1.p2  ORF type:complete len:159 (+),score=32.80 TRINITY_DN7936_c0_g2_i1:48-479(+)
MCIRDRYGAEGMKYSLQAMVCVKKEEEYNSMYKMGKEWNSCASGVNVKFRKWESLAKWIILENKVPVILIYQLDENADNETEMSDSCIQKLYKFINEKKEEPQEKKELPKLEDTPEDNLLKWSCRYCTAINELPNYTCSGTPL